MLIGLALLVVGITMVIRNRQLAVTLGFDEAHSSWGFKSSAARQNFAVIGLAIAVMGMLSIFLL